MMKLALAILLATACADAEKPRAASSMPFAIDKVVRSFDGTVAEVIPVAGYVYLRVDDAWVVSLKKPFAVGDRVAVRQLGQKDGFVSKQLGRTFDRLSFAIVNNKEKKS